MKAGVMSSMIPDQPFGLNKPVDGKSGGSGFRIGMKGLTRRRRRTSETMNTYYNVQKSKMRMRGSEIRALAEQQSVFSIAFSDH